MEFAIETKNERIKLLQDKVDSWQTYAQDKLVPKEAYRQSYNEYKEKVEQQLSNYQTQIASLTAKLSVYEGNGNTNTNPASSTLITEPAFINTQNTNNKTRSSRKSDLSSQNVELYNNIDHKIQSNWNKDKYYWDNIDITDEIGDSNQRSSFYNRAKATELARICLYANIGVPKVRKNTHGATGLMTHVGELRSYCSLNWVRSNGFIEYLEREGWSKVCTNKGDSLTTKEIDDIKDIYFDYHKDYKGENISFQRQQESEHGNHRNHGSESESENHDHGNDEMSRDRENSDNRENRNNRNNNNDHINDLSVSAQQQPNQQSDIQT